MFLNFKTYEVLFTFRQISDIFVQSSHFFGFGTSHGTGHSLLGFQPSALNFKKVWYRNSTKVCFRGNCSFRNDELNLLSFIWIFLKFKPARFVVQFLTMFFQGIAGFAGFRLSCWTDLVTSFCSVPSQRSTTFRIFFQAKFIKRQTVFAFFNFWAFYRTTDFRIPTKCFAMRGMLFSTGRVQSFING